MHLREKDLENHFEGEDKSAPKDVKKEEKKDEKKDDPKDKQAALKPEDALKSDYQVMRALDLLKGWEILKNMSDK